MEWAASTAAKGSCILLLAALLLWWYLLCLRGLEAPEHPEFNTMTPPYVLLCELSLGGSLFGLGHFRSGMLLCHQPVHQPHGVTCCTAYCFFLHKFSKVSEWPDLMDYLPEVGGWSPEVFAWAYRFLFVLWYFNCWVQPANWIGELSLVFCIPEMKPLCLCTSLFPM